MAEEYCSTPARALRARDAAAREGEDGAVGRADRRRRASSPTTSARCSRALPGPAGGDLPALRRLEKRGLVTITERVARRAPRTNPAADRAGRAHAGADRRAGRDRGRAGRRAPAARRHRLGQDRGLPARGGGGAGARRGRDRARAGDRADAADRRALRRRASGTRSRCCTPRCREGERYDEWRRLRTGEARIAVGPRSAVFAPVEQLGLIVVDEEHDASYKHEGDPRYDARHVAAYRAYQTGARLLAGSATPRPETVHTDARGCGCPTRVARRPRPAARARARHARRRSTRCTPRRAAALGARAQVDRAAQPPRLVELPHLQVVREGVGVPELRRRARPAPRRARDRLPPLRPPRARPDALRRLRLARRRPPRRGHRARRGRAARTRSTSPSSGSTPTPRRTRTRCPSCSRASTPRPTGLLLGTQMVAKGHDFPDVTLGVVLDADSHAALPRLPRRGAHVRADRPARGPRRPRPARRARARADHARPTRPRSSPPPATTPTASSRASSQRRRALRYPPFADLIRVVTSAADGRPRPRRRGPHRRGDRASPRHRAARPGAAVPPARPRALPDRRSRPRARAAAIHATGAAVEAAARDKAFKEVNSPSTWTRV